MIFSCFAGNRSQVNELVLIVVNAFSAVTLINFKRLGEKSPLKDSCDIEVTKKSMCQTKSKDYFNGEFEYCSTTDQ